MPTSNGFDRTNYGTTVNFSRYAVGGGGNAGPTIFHPHRNQQQLTPPQMQYASKQRSNPNVSLASSANDSPPTNSQKFFTQQPQSRSNGHSYKQHYVASKNFKSPSMTSSSSPNVASLDTSPNFVRTVDPNSVNIKDPNLRELVQKLVKVNDQTG